MTWIIGEEGSNDRQVEGVGNDKIDNILAEQDSVEVERITSHCIQYTCHNIVRQPQHEFTTAVLTSYLVLLKVMKKRRFVF